MKIDQKDKIKKITEQLEEEVLNMFDSEKYKNYLDVMSKFHNYSLNNTLLIAMQNPEATRVAGYHAWEEKFQRNVKKGEKGINIFVPSSYTVYRSREKIDPFTEEPVRDTDGNVIIEKVPQKLPCFKIATVFDISQTEGKELPEIATRLTNSVESFDVILHTLRQISKVPITFEPITSGANGYYSSTKKAIVIKEGLSDAQTLKTAIHEIAHSKLHDYDTGKEKDADRRTKEVEAESIAYVVCQNLGIDTSNYSFGYIAGWSSGKDITELRQSIETIRTTATEIINAFEKEYIKSQEIIEEVEGYEY